MKMKWKPSSTRRHCPDCDYEYVSFGGDVRYCDCCGTELIEDIEFYCGCCGKYVGREPPLFCSSCGIELEEPTSDDFSTGRGKIYISPDLKTNIIVIAITFIVAAIVVPFFK